MALAPYTVTALADSDANGTNGKNIVEAAVITLTDTNGNAATMFDDEAGANGSTAKTTNANGQRVIYAEAGEYTLSVNAQDSSIFIGAPINSTQALVLSKKGSRTGDIYEASAGYYGDGDFTAKWKATATTGLTPSQSPADRAAAELTDATGRLWELVTIAGTSTAEIPVKALGGMDGADVYAVAKAAVESAKAIGRATVLFDGGVYELSQSLSVTLTGSPKFNIKGINGAKITAASGFSAGKLLLILSSGVTGGSVTIEGLELDATNVPNSGVGEANDAIYVSGAFDNVVVYDCKLYAGTAFATSGSDSGVFIAEANKMTVENCEIKGFPDAGIYISGDATGTIGENFTARNNDIEECAVAVITKRLHRKSVISGNYIKKCSNGISGGSADGVAPGVSMIISGNVLERCTVGISPRIDSGAVVTGNTLIENGYDGSLISIKAIALQGSSNCVVTGNTIRGINPDIPAKGSDMIAILLERRTFDDVNYDPDNNLIGLNNISGMGTGVEDASICTNTRVLLNSIEDTTVPYNLTGDYIKQEGNGIAIGGSIDGSSFDFNYNSSTGILNMNNFADVRIDNLSIPRSSRASGGTGSAGAGNQYVEINIAGTTYKVLHDGTI